MSKLPVIGLIVVAAALAACQKQTNSASAPVATPLAEKKSPPPQPVVAEKTYDGPFGLAGKMSTAELARLDFKPLSFNPSLYKGVAPRPMEGINDYVVLATPEAGVCRIMANADVSVVNGSGDQIKEKVDQLAELMATKYGKRSSKTDFANQDVYRRNPEFWMMALTEDSVAYGYTWEAGKTETALPDDLQSIEIFAGATQIRSGWAQIRYNFKNIKDCQESAKKRKAANL